MESYKTLLMWMYETCNTRYRYLNHYRWTLHSEFTFLFISMNPPLVLCENYMYRKIMHAQIKLVRFEWWGMFIGLYKLFRNEGRNRGKNKMQKRKGHFIFVFSEGKSHFSNDKDNKWAWFGIMIDFITVYVFVWIIISILV